MAGIPVRTLAHRPRRRARSSAALVLAGALALTACSGGDDEAGTTTSGSPPQSQSTAEGTTLSATWPFTGLTRHGAAPKRPPILVKVDNTSSSEPQIGLAKADLVVEELVEGGATRLAAFYYSQLPDTVGPVRSMRASDIGVVKPAHAVLVASGGAPPTVRRMARAHVRTVTEGGPGFFREDSRPAPYNLFMHLPELARTLKAGKPPEAYLPWGSEKALPSGRPARTFGVAFSGGHTTSWRYRGGRYTNVNGYAADGDRFRPDTVLVLRVRVGDAGYLDPAGNPVPETKFTGTGKAMVFHDGEVVRGTWRKDGLADTVSLRTKGGALRIPAGHVWVELVPRDGGDVRVGR